MTESNRRENLQAEWRLSEQAWQEGEVLLGAAHPRGALSRFDYSAFHAACAALLAEGLEAASHSGVRSLFSLHFLKNGRLDTELARSLASLQQQREDADYERDLEIDELQATLAREDAARVRGAISGWLRAHDWM